MVSPWGIGVWRSPAEREVHYFPWENERNLGFGLLKTKQKVCVRVGEGGNRVGGRKRIGERNWAVFER